jgi:hypothetical protein
VNGQVWAGRVIRILILLFLLFDGITKVMREQHVLAATAQLGFPLSSVVGIGITLLACTALYMIPRTTILGGLLLTAYLGGATAVQARIGGPIWFSIVFGMLLWIGLLCDEPRLRSLVPLKK